MRSIYLRFPIIYFVNERFNSSSSSFRIISISLTSLCGDQRCKIIPLHPNLCVILSGISRASSPISLLFEEVPPFFRIFVEKGILLARLFESNISIDNSKVIFTDGWVFWFVSRIESSCSLSFSIFSFFEVNCCINYVILHRIMIVNCIYY